jgi:hypothetical protein
MTEPRSLYLLQSVVGGHIQSALDFTWALRQGYDMWQRLVRRDKVVSQTNKDIKAANEYLADDLQVSLIRQEKRPGKSPKGALEASSSLRERHSHIAPAEVESDMT